MGDKDGLWHDFKYMYTELNLADYPIFVVAKKFVIINNLIACDWSDIEVQVQEKLLRRLQKK